jgi:hypothetical protein
MKISVKVQNDYLERMSNVQKPIMAVEELIWNGLDADATQVKVRFEENPLGALETITVTDNGTGLLYEDAVTAFENLGGSWKRTAKKTKTKQRLLHGKAGKGRFRAFALGKTVKWTTRYSQDNSVHEYSIVGQKEELGTFDISDPAASSSAKTGTEVEIRGIEKNFRSLTDPSGLQAITERFALYLREYPDVKITYDTRQIDPALVEEHVQDYTLDDITLEDGRAVKLSITVIEWKAPTERALYLCDSQGFALMETSPGIQARGFNFTAYLKSGFLRELDEQGSLVFDVLHPDLKKLLDAAKETLREHFRRRTAESAANLVETWKKDKIYPFVGEPANILEVTERQVFDVVALNLNEYLPDFEKADPKSKQLALSLLKHALEDSPTAVRRILEDVLDLPKEKEEFAELLNKTSLAAIINAAKVVADRLEFLQGLEVLLFKPEVKEALLERKQLHRILAIHTWIFGEEFNLTVDDQSLTEVLKKHLGLLGRDPGNPEPVVPEEGSRAIVDLMLSRLIPQPRADEREHLVIELKRPSQPVDTDVANQIRKYAFAVAEDERFRDTKTRWVFWAISNEITPSVRREARQSNRPEGLLHDDEEQRIKIWVKSWGQIIEACRARLTFFQEKLEYAANQDSGLAYLQRTHEKYLPKVLKKKAEP